MRTKFHVRPVESRCSKNCGFQYELKFVDSTKILSKPIIKRTNSFVQVGLFPFSFYCPATEFASLRPVQIVSEVHTALDYCTGVVGLHKQAEIAQLLRDHGGKHPVELAQEKRKRNDGQQVRSNVQAKRYVE